MLMSKYEQAIPGVSGVCRHAEEEEEGYVFIRRGAIGADSLDLGG